MLFRSQNGVSLLLLFLLCSHHRAVQAFFLVSFCFCFFSLLPYASGDNRSTRLRVSPFRECQNLRFRNPRVLYLLPPVQYHEKKGAVECTCTHIYKKFYMSFSNNNNNNNTRHECSTSHILSITKNTKVQSKAKF